MKTPTDCFHVLTGGPGSGKTTLIDALAKRGSAASLEAGRAIIRDQRAIGGTALPWSDRQLFAELMLAFDMRSFTQAREWRGPVFFDRGVPDVLGYLELCGLPVPPHAENAARSFNYARRVFLLPPWPEIFTADEERRQSPDEARRTCDAMIAVYSRLGYELVEVPKIPIDERADFVLANINS
jgi:predicted ATPase